MQTATLKPWMIPGLNDPKIQDQITYANERSITAPMIVRMIVNYYLDDQDFRTFLGTEEVEPKVSEVIKLLESPWRKRELTNVRFTINYFLLTYTNLGTKATGLLFKRDHSTAIHGRDTYQEIAQVDRQAFKRHKQLCEILNLKNHITSILK